MRRQSWNSPAMRRVGGYVAQTTITLADVGLRSERGPILGSVMLSVALVALDSTILATAVPAIVDDLGGFAQFPWLFSIFLLAQAVSVPIFAKLSDQFGRKPIMLIGVGTFVLGSVLCGLAWSMPALIAFRALQGLGAGAVQPMGMTIIGDIYSVAERAKVQGYVASVWATSSVVGPTLGGLFVDYANWRWIFFVNIPLGAVAAWALIRRFSERVDRTKPKLDLAGSGLLTAGSSLLILGLLGVMLIGLVSYIPLYAQVVLGKSALVAGFAVAAMTLGWPIAASVAGRIYLRIGFRATALIGAAVIVGGAVLLSLISPSSSIWQLGATCFVVGLGLGLAASPTLIAAQSAVDWAQRGVVTGTNVFARSMGSALGIAVFGAIVNSALGDRIGAHPSTAAGIPPSALDPALHQVFLAAAVVAALLLAAVALMPRTPARELAESA
jgi:multidrug resistance protein